VLVSGPDGRWWFRFTRDGIESKLRHELRRRAREYAVRKAEEIYRPRQESPNE